MSRFHQEILDVMSSLEALDENHARASFSFPKVFVGFQGHFEGRPVLPGICKLRSAQVVFESVTRKSVRMVEITLAKYFSPVTPDEKIVIDCRWQEKGKGLWDLKASVTRKEAKVALLQLVLSDES